MPRLKPRQKAAKAILGVSGKFTSACARASMNSLYSELVNLLTGEDVDEDILEISVDEDAVDAQLMEQTVGVSVLIWTEAAPTAFVRRGESLRNRQHLKQKQQLLADSVRGKEGSILKHFQPVAPPVVVDYNIEEHLPGQHEEAGVQPVVETQERMTVAVEQLKEGVAKVHNNARKEKQRKQFSFFYKLQHLAGMCYFKLRLLGRGKGDASVEVANALFSSVSVNSYKARCIPRWAQGFLATGRISESRHGTHTCDVLPATEQPLTGHHP
jgi:hypothetical protein